MDLIRKALDPLNFLHLGACSRRMLNDETARLPSLPLLQPSAIANASEHHFRDLRHPLSEHFMALNGEKPAHHRSQLEAAVLDQAIWPSANIGNLPTFRRSLRGLNRLLTERRSGWRRDEIRLAKDRNGNRVQFPPAAIIPGQLEKIWFLLCDKNAGPAIFKAAIVHLLLVNCHPFTDGNGRVARVLFNHVLRQGGMPKDVYFPLYEIANRSCGGHEIALRYAELRGEWEPLLAYLINALNSYRRIASDGVLSTKPTPSEVRRQNWSND